MKRTAALFASLVPLFCTSGAITTLSVEAQEKKVVLHFFYGRECPHCKRIEPEIESLVKSNPRLELKKYEVWYNTDNRALLMRMTEERGKSAQGVPIVIIGADVYLGSDMAKIRDIAAKNTRKHN
ncbi:MAG TPA: thioredoxin family protein [Spirochaetota bacterium]|nr:thioredoxin family protein [Spirochaetota bacterium]